MKKRSVLSGLAIATIVAGPVSAGPMCSIHPAKGLSDSQLSTLAKVSRTEAEKIALARVKSKAAVSLTSAELEAEDGCLLWSFDLKVAGESGVQEVQVDAGDGKILSVRHETARQESAEAAQEAAGADANRPKTQPK